MKKLIYLLPLVLMACAPGKKSEPIYFDIYCNNCYVKIENMWYDGPGADKAVVKEYPFDGMVVNYKKVEFHRFDSPNTCARLTAFTNYSTDTCWIYIIENNDTIAILEDGGNGYCY